MSSESGKKLDDSFLTRASDTLGETNTGLSGENIVKYCSAYSNDFNKRIPYDNYPFETKNKRTDLLENLQAFDAKEQFIIIKELCELDFFKNNDNVKKLKTDLYERYENYSTKIEGTIQLVQETKDFLEEYPDALNQYQSGLDKYEKGIFNRNTLDDMRLAFELLMKGMLNNNKSLENQKNGIGILLKQSGVSKELRGMVTTVISYYEKFQNENVKHNDNVNACEMGFVIEFTSVIMKFMIQARENKEEK